MGRNIIKKYEAKATDPETGEIRSYVSSMEVMKEDAEPFFLTYSRQIIALYDLPLFNVTTKVFWKLLEYADFNTGKVYMNATRKKEIMDICKISRASYYRALGELEKADIVKIQGDVYVINEDMFWKGDRKTRAEIQKAKMQLSFLPIMQEEQIAV